MKLFAATMAIAMLLVPAAALAGPSIVGNFQDWNPADPAYDLTLNANGVYVLTISAGDSQHVYKAVDGDAWGQDFPGNNQTFTPGTPQSVTWYVNLGAVPGTKEGDEYVFHSLNPPIVCGSFMSELGGSDWDQTDTSTTVMSDGDGDDVWEFSSVIPAGTYQFKIVLNNNWDQDTYPPSQNYVFGSDGVTPVTFKYHMATNTTEVVTAAPPSVLYGRIPSDCPQDPSNVEIKFSEAMEETSAETAGNYTVNDPVGTTVVSATRDDTDNSVVVLVLSPALAAGDEVDITVSGVLAEDDSQPVDPSNNQACFLVEEVIFELNMHLYVDANGVPTSVHIQGDTSPLTWGLCEGCEAVDDGTGNDAAAGDTTYTVTQYFSVEDNCASEADTFQIKYKYVLDCATWEGDFDFGHYLDVNPDFPTQTHNVWWDDVAPVDNIECDVGVLFQVHNSPACGNGLYVRGSESPLDWSIGVELLDDGTGGDVTSGDGIYSAEVVFPTGTYRFLDYKYFCAESDTSGTYECDTLPNRSLELDDVNGCITVREGPMLIEDLWNWCEPVTGIQAIQQKSWGAIKSIYKN